MSDLLKRMQLAKDDVMAFAKELHEPDIETIVGWTAEKDDEVRYAAWLTCKCLSEIGNAVYPYWSIFASKLKSPDSYQRNIGAAIIAVNVKWDVMNHFAETIGDYLKLCDDEKFVTSRWAIQNIQNWYMIDPRWLPRILQTLSAIDLAKKKNTQKSLLAKDILAVLELLQETKPGQQIAALAHRVIGAGLEDPKEIKRYLEWFS
jgi:hypothetical protein